MAARNWISELTGPVAWSAVVGGVFVALVVHILLNMLGAGIGASSMEVRTPTQVKPKPLGGAPSRGGRFPALLLPLLEVGQPAF